MNIVVLMRSLGILSLVALYALLLSAPLQRVFPFLSERINVSRLQKILGTLTLFLGLTHAALGVLLIQAVSTVHMGSMTLGGLGLLTVSLLSFSRVRSLLKLHSLVIPVLNVAGMLVLIHAASMTIQRTELYFVMASLYLSILVLSSLQITWVNRWLQQRWNIQAPAFVPVGISISSVLLFLFLF